MVRAAQSSRLLSLKMASDNVGARRTRLSAERTWGSCRR